MHSATRMLIYMHIGERYALVFRLETACLHFSAGRDEVAAKNGVLIGAPAEACGGHGKHAQALLDHLCTHGRMHTGAPPASLKRQNFYAVQLRLLAQLLLVSEIDQIEHARMQSRQVLPSGKARWGSLEASTTQTVDTQISIVKGRGLRTPSR